MGSKLAALVEEQRRLQIEGDTNRSNTLEEYSKILNLPDMKNPSPNVYLHGLGGLLLDYLQANREIVWVDLASGNAIALRQGKIFLEKQGVDTSRLRTYGFDALPVDISLIQYLMKHLPEEFEETLLNLEYAPELYQKDILSVKFPETPDIITCSEALFWTDDPLQVFTNAANQAKVGATLLMNRLSKASYESANYPGVFEELIRRFDGLPGLDIKFYMDAAGIIATKTEPFSDLNFGLNVRDKQLTIEGYVHTYIDA
jgi:hypothetical protein